jgi:hypothetical protein
MGNSKEIRLFLNLIASPKTTKWFQKNGGFCRRLKQCDLGIGLFDGTGKEGAA